jgi:hypothetical protein
MRPLARTGLTGLLALLWPHLAGADPPAGAGALDASAVERSPTPPTASQEAPAPAEPMAPAVPPPARATSPRRPAQWWIAVEGGAFHAGRELGYAGASQDPTPLLHGLQGPLAGPWLFVEVFPVAPFTGHVLLEGVGLFAEYAFAAGLETTVGSQRYPSSFSSLDAGLQWRLRPIPSSGFALVPAVSFQARRFAVTPPLPGLPDSNLSGVAASLRAEVPLGALITLHLGGGYTRWLRAEDLVGDDFFSAGSAFAVEAEAGVAVRIEGPLSLRILGFYDTTRYALEVGPRPQYRATGASDTQLGGRATVCARF